MREQFSSEIQNNQQTCFFDYLGLIQFLNVVNLPETRTTSTTSKSSPPQSTTTLTTTTPSPSPPTTTTTTILTTTTTTGTCNIFTNFVKTKRTI